jgi:AcrR family transcriptional regulator
MIAERAQRPLSLLAHHFGNKEGLYLEVFKFIFEQKACNDALSSIPSEGCTPKDRDEALDLLRQQLRNLFQDVSERSVNSDPVHELGGRLWLQEIRAPRPSLAPIFDIYIRPLTETIRKCIQTLRPDLEEEAVTFLGISILGQIVGHGLMRGLNEMVWPKTEQAECHPHASQWLLDLCLNGLLGSPVHRPEP